MCVAACSNCVSVVCFAVFLACCACRCLLVLGLIRVMVACSFDFVCLNVLLLFLVAASLVCCVLCLLLPAGLGIDSCFGCLFSR